MEESKAQNLMCSLKHIISYEVAKSLLFTFKMFNINEESNESTFYIKKLRLVVSGEGVKEIPQHAEKQYCFML